MELFALQSIAAGITSLAELERTDPVLGAKLNEFVARVNDACRTAYDRFSRHLDDVLTLPSNPTGDEVKLVLTQLRDASDSHWFKDVAGICDNLAALANKYDADLRQHLDLARNRGTVEQRGSLNLFLEVLHRHEGDLIRDIRNCADALKIDLSEGRIPDAKDRAKRIKDEIATTLTRINGVALTIAGSSTGGALAGC